MNMLPLSAFGNKMGVDKMLHKSHHLYCMLPPRHYCGTISFWTLAISHHMQSEFLLEHEGIWAAFLWGGEVPLYTPTLKLAVFNKTVC